ncbi:MAG: hypothetical protein JXJ04_20485 [Spirochaetales bacterium]|nr:hypothetical protein [Spirochaetales bacterium]
MSKYISVFITFIIILVVSILFTLWSMVFKIKKLKQNETHVISYKVVYLPVIGFILFLLVFLFLFYLFAPSKELAKHEIDTQDVTLTVLNVDCNWYVKKNFASGFGSTPGSFKEIAKIFEYSSLFRLNFFENTSIQKSAGSVAQKYREFNLADKKNKDELYGLFVKMVGLPTTFNRNEYVFDRSKYSRIKSTSMGYVREYLNVLRIIKEVLEYFSGEKEKNINTDVFIIFLSFESDTQTFLTSLDYAGGSRDFTGPYPEGGCNYYFAYLVLDRNGAFTERSSLAYKRLIYTMENSRNTISIPQHKIHFRLDLKEVRVWILIITGMMIIAFFASLFLNKLIVKLSRK